MRIFIVDSFGVCVLGNTEREFIVSEVGITEIKEIIVVEEVVTPTSIFEHLLEDMRLGKIPLMEGEREPLTPVRPVPRKGKVREAFDKIRRR